MIVEIGKNFLRRRPDQRAVFVVMRRFHPFREALHFINSAAYMSGI